MKDSFDVFGRDGVAQDPGSTSRTLIESLWADDPEGWSKMVNLYGPTIYRWCRKNFSLSEEDACDVGQEVLGYASRTIGRFDVRPRDASFRGWLFTITRGKAVDLIRKNVRRMEVSEGDLLDEIPLNYQDLCERDSAEANAQDRDIERRLQPICAEFKPSTWQAFWQTVVLERSVDDVCADLDMTRNAVYVARSRVFSRLRAEFAGSDE